MIEITVHGATIIIDSAAGTLRPRTHEDGMILGVGYRPGDTAEHERQRAARAEAVDTAIKLAGRPQYGWTWLDPDYGTPVYFQIGRASCRERGEICVVAE